MLWTRLSSFYNLSADIFGEDLEMEVGKPLISGRVVELGDIKGWEYNYFKMTSEELEGGSDFTEWHPAALSDAEFVMMNQLCNDCEVDINDPKLVRFLINKGESVERLCASLSVKRLTTLSGRHPFIILS